MVVGDVDEGLGFDALFGLSASVIAYQLKIREAFRAEAQVLRHDSALPVVQIFKGGQEGFLQLLAQEHMVGIGRGGAVGFLCADLAIVIAVLSVEIHTAHIPQAALQQIPDGLWLPVDGLGDDCDGFVIVPIIMLCKDRHGLAEHGILVPALDGVAGAHGADIVMDGGICIELLVGEEGCTTGFVVALQRLGQTQQVGALQTVEVAVHCVCSDGSVDALVYFGFIMMEEPGQILFVLLFLIQINVRLTGQLWWCRLQAKLSSFVVTFFALLHGTHRPFLISSVPLYRHKAFHEPYPARTAYAHRIHPVRPLIYAPSPA